MMTPRGLSQEDLRVLLRGSSDDERAVVAHRICCRVDTNLSDEGRVAAAEVLRLMAADAAEMVRRALAVTLRSSSSLPRDVALALAQDVESIATPILTFSPVFTENDLCELVASSEGTRQLAIARRAVLPPDLCGAIGAHGEEPTVATALANEEARFTEEDLLQVLLRFAHSGAVTSAMSYRRTLPLAVAERLVTLVGEDVRRHLVDRHALSPETAMEIALSARERATLDLIEQAGRATDIDGFVVYLHSEGRLTFSLVLRALAHGHVVFMEHALAVLGGVAHHRAWLLIHDAGPLGLKAICEKAAVPEAMYPALRAGLDGFRSLQLEGAQPSAFADRMLERLLTRPSTTSKDDADELLRRMASRRARPR